MIITVFGASGPVGRAVVDRALSADHGVIAVTRHPDRFGPQKSGVRVVGGDVTDLSRVDAALEGADVVISTIGVNPSRQPVTTYSSGTAQMLAVMRNRGLRRIVSVSSKNVAEQGFQGEQFAYRWLLGPLLHRVNRSVYDDMRRMEELLRDSDRDWTIVRPAGLFAAERVSAYRCICGHQPGVFTSVVDLADALVSEAVSDRPRVGAVLEVLTDVDTPSLVKLIAGQASLHRRSRCRPLSDPLRSCLFRGVCRKV